jgi:hypothetical protein
MPEATDCGHICCDDRHDRFHDHWLEPGECPSCERVRVVTTGDTAGQEEADA